MASHLGYVTCGDSCISDIVLSCPEFCFDPMLRPMNNPWDHLSERFDTHKDTADIYPSVADNILLAWPSLFRGIEAVQPNGHGLRALDFGCGGGLMAKELQARGYQLTACDTSPRMINIAQSNLTGIDLHCAGPEAVAAFPQAPFDLIVSVMVFQFIEEIEACLNSFDLALGGGGVLAFAVFNPAYIEVNTGEQKPFRRAEEGMTLVLGGHPIPVYVRDEQTYATMLEKRGYRKVHIDFPPFTENFLAKYPLPCDTSSPEFLVMVYQRGN